MWHNTVCTKCGSKLRYEKKSVHEGNRENEDIRCPVCKTIIDTVYTDIIPSVIVVEKHNFPEADKK